MPNRCFRPNLVTKENGNTVSITPFQTLVRCTSRLWVDSLNQNECRLYVCISSLMKWLNVLYYRGPWTGTRCDGSVLMVVCCPPPSYCITHRQPAVLSPPSLSLAKALLFDASSSSTMSCGRTVMCTTFADSALNLHSVTVCVLVM